MKEVIKMPVFSVIIPVYDSEKYVYNAIDSILNQKFCDFELILIDDKAKGNCPKICDLYSKKDSRVIVKHMDKNGGICKARNTGLKMAKGDYICFCDDDDLWHSDLLLNCKAIIDKFNPDMIKFGRELVDIIDDKIIRKSTNEFSEYIYLNSSDKILKNFFDIQKTNVLNNVWNGVYKRKIIVENCMGFNEFMKFGSEDSFFSLDFLIYSKTFYLIPDRKSVV